MNSEESRRGVVYGLKDPRSGELRYVGKTILGADYRLKKHLYSRDGTRKSKLYSWMRSIRPLDPTLVVLEANIDEQMLDDREIYWIAASRQAGCRLTNLTEGGDGGHLDPSSIEKMADSLRGRKLSRDHRDAISRGLTGHKRGRYSDEHRAAISSSLVGRTLSAAHRAAIAAGNLGTKRGPYRKKAVAC